MKYDFHIAENSAVPRSVVYRVSDGRDVAIFDASEFDLNTAEAVAEVLNALAEPAPAVAEVPRARVVVGLEGGIVQGASANVPGIEVLILDYDTDGADADRVREVPQERGADVEAYTYAFDADNAPAWVDSVAAVVLA